MPKEQEQREIITPVAEPRSADLEVTAEQQEWFRLAGFSRIEWQRLVYARWLHHQGLLTEYPPEH
jgi:hypothetical protein